MGDINLWALSILSPAHKSSLLRSKRRSPPAAVTRGPPVSESGSRRPERRHSFHAPRARSRSPQVETKTASRRGRLRTPAPLSFLPGRATRRHARRVGAAAVRGRLVLVFFHARQPARRRADPAGVGGIERAWMDLF